MISALKNNGIEDILKLITKNAPSSPWFYNKDYYTTASSRFIASEIIREKLFFKLNYELPYNLAVIIESWEESHDKSVKIHATIYTSRSSHKNIIIGKKARLIKEIGQEARIELSNFFETKIQELALLLHAHTHGEDKLRPLHIAGFLVIKSILFEALGFYPSLNCVRWRLSFPSICTFIFLTH